MSASNCQILWKRFLEHAQEGPEKAAFVVLNSQLEKVEELTFGALLEESLRLAGGLAERAKPGDRIVLSLATGLDFVRSFLACQNLGLIPVPLPPVSHQRSRDRFQGVFEDCQPTLVLATSRGKTILEKEFPEAKVCEPGELMRGDQVSDGEPHEIAFLQYTSGTTGRPKGVIISQENLATNLSAISSLTSRAGDEVALNWLPLHHDFGLVGGILRGLWQGNLTYLMSPSAIRQSPRVWLEALSRFEVNVTSGTQTILAACLEEEYSGINFGCLEALFLGGEFTAAETLRACRDRFSDAGLKGEALRPIYGMAEATLAATNGGGLNAEGEVHCGSAIAGIELSLVDGELVIEGATVSPGYWGEPVRTEPLKTGDLAKIDSDGKVIILGRRKHLIVINGENFHAEDLEFRLEKEGLGPAIVAPCSSKADLGFLVISEHSSGGSGAQRMQEIKEHFESQHGLSPERVALVRRGFLPRTSSGKPERLAARDRLLAGTLSVISEWQAGDAEEEKSHRTRAEIAAWLKEQLAQALEIEAATIPENVDFHSLGLDSAHAVSFALELEDFAGVELAASALFEYPTIELISNRLGSEHS